MVLDVLDLLLLLDVILEVSTLEVPLGCHVGIQFAQQKRVLLLNLLQEFPGRRALLKLMRDAEYLVLVFLQGDSLRHLMIDVSFHRLQVLLLLHFLDFSGVAVLHDLAHTAQQNFKLSSRISEWEMRDEIGKGLGCTRVSILSKRRSILQNLATLS